MLLIVNKSLPLKRGEVFHHVQDAVDAVDAENKAKQDINAISALR